MARHLYIGNAATMSYTDGVLADGAIDIQKLSATGPTSMTLLDTIQTAQQFRIVQGNGTTNIVSPWVYGRDVINYSGKAYSAPASQSSTIQVTGAATNTADVDVTIKLVNTTNGQFDPFDAKSYTVTTRDTAINTAAEIGDNFTGAMNADYSISGSASLSATQTDELPWFVKTVAWDGTNTITLIGWDKGETMQNGQIAEYPSSFDIVIENGDAVANGGTYTIATGTPASRGYGYGEYVYEMESELMGINYGYYNRVQQPVAPSNTAVKTTGYDMFNIAATKDGSSSSQIHGVDNLIDLNIAFSSSASAAQLNALQGVLNNYFTSAGFPALSL